MPYARISDAGPIGWNRRQVSLFLVDGTKDDRLASPNPGRRRSKTSSVASGVTSRGAGPLPPVTRMSEHRSSSVGLFAGSDARICRRAGAAG